MYPVRYFMLPSFGTPTNFAIVDRQPGFATAPRALSSAGYGPSGASNTPANSPLCGVAQFAATMDCTASFATVTVTQPRPYGRGPVNAPRRLAAGVSGSFSSTSRKVTRSHRNQRAPASQCFSAGRVRNSCSRPARQSSPRKVRAEPAHSSYALRRPVPPTGGSVVRVPSSPVNCPTWTVSTSCVAVQSTGSRGCANVSGLAPNSR